MESGVAIKVISEANEILSSLNVTCWLTDGTLLGFYREKDFISHDKDVDLGVDISTWNELIIPTMCKNGFKLIGNRGEIDDGLEYSFIKDGIAIDLFFFYAESDKVWHSAWLNNLQLKFSYPKFGLKPVTFLGHQFLAPQDEECFLRIKYGNGWNTPDTKWHWAYSPHNVELASDTLSNKIRFRLEYLRWKVRSVKKWYRKKIKNSKSVPNTLSTKYLRRMLEPRVRIKEGHEPRLSILFLDRYQFMNLDRAKLTKSTSRKFKKARNLSVDFSISSHGKLAILIPFRNREAHLAELLPSLRKTLHEQQVDYHVFVVDQVDKNPFNRAKLINVGFDYAKEEYDYFTMHDVDLLPINATYQYPSHPLRNTGVIRNSTGERKVSSFNVGGVVTINKDHFITINGMSNNFWHWGKEDDNFLCRLLNCGINPVIDTLGVYDEIDGSTDRFNVSNGEAVVIDKKKANRMIAANKRHQDKVMRGLVPACDEGLSTLEYRIEDVEKMDKDVTRLSVHL